MREQGRQSGQGSGLERALAVGRALGPASEAALARRWARRSLQIRLGRGDSPGNAPVALLALRARRDGAIAGELLRDVMSELMDFGSLVMPPYMRRLHDPDDLVVSVLGDCFREVFQATIAGRQDLVLILQSRIRWKSQSRGRSMLSLKRREDLLSETSERDLDEWSSGPSPLAQVAAREELRGIAQRLRSLTGRDRTVLAMHLAQHSAQEIADRVQVTPDAVRRMVQRLLGQPGESE